MLRDRDAPTYGEALAEVLFQRGTDKQKHVVVGVSPTTHVHGMYSLSMTLRLCLHTLMHE